MNFEQHKNHGVLVALGVALGYYMYYAANYYSQNGEIFLKLDVFISSLIMFSITIAGSLAPDLDTKSTTTRFVAIFMTIWWGIILFTNYFPVRHSYYAAIASFVLFMCLGTKHRSFTHAFGWPAIALFVSMTTGNFYVGAFGFGLLVHYYCDGINPFDLRNWWFNPFKKSFWI